MESVGSRVVCVGALTLVLSYMKSFVLGDSDAGGDLESRGRDVIVFRRGQDRTGRERRSIDFAIPRGCSRVTCQMSDSTIVLMSWVT